MSSRPYSGFARQGGALPSPVSLSPYLASPSPPGETFLFAGGRWAGFTKEWAPDSTRALPGEKGLLFPCVARLFA